VSSDRERKRRVTHFEVKKQEPPREEGAKSREDFKKKTFGGSLGKKLRNQKTDEEASFHGER